MRVRTIGFGQQSTQPDEMPAPAGAAALKTAADAAEALGREFLAIVSGLDGQTPIDAFKNLRAVQEKAKKIEEGLVTVVRTSLPPQPVYVEGSKPIRQFLHSIRFAASKAASNLWRSLTPDGRSATRADAKGVLDATPPLVNAMAKDDKGYRIGIKYDVETQRFILPNGKVAPGNRIGQEKARLGWKEADHAERMKILASLKLGGGYMKASDVRDALDQAKPIPADKIREKQEKAAATKSKESARPVGPVGKGKSFGRLGYAWEVDQPVAEHLTQLQPTFNAAPLETQIVLLDRTSDVSSALDAKDALGLSEEDVLEILKEPVGTGATGAGTIHPAVYWVGGAVAVALILYFVLRKKS